MSPTADMSQSLLEIHLFEVQRKLRLLARATVRLDLAGRHLAGQIEEDIEEARLRLLHFLEQVQDGLGFGPEGRAHLAHCEAIVASNREQVRELLRQWG